METTPRGSGVCVYVQTWDRFKGGEGRGWSKAGEVFLAVLCWTSAPPLQKREARTHFSHTESGLSPSRKTFVGEGRWQRRHRFSACKIEELMQTPSPSGGGGGDFERTGEAACR
jgi:hypothetical protein